MLPPQRAWSRIAEHLEPITAVSVAREECLGRVVAVEPKATVDVPASDVSAMDGFALGPGVESGPKIPVVGTLAAGEPPGATLELGVAMRIMTGAPVPSGCERVVPIEQTEPAERFVVIRELGEPGQHIRRRGEIVESGKALLRSGHLIVPGTLSVLATHGLAEVEVVGRPRVAYLTTGSEVVPPFEKPGPGQLRDSHSDFFAAATRQLGLAAEALGIVPDDPGRLQARIASGLEREVLLISGGVSMGDFDLVEAAIAELGGEILIRSVAIQPGKPMVVARHPGGWVFALPGNPASAMVTFWLFVRPALRRMMGLWDAFWHGALAARLDGPLPGAKGRERFLPCSVRFRSGELHVLPHPPAGSHDVAAYGCGTGLVRVPALSEPRQAGESCEVLPLVEWPEPVLDDDR